MRNFSKLAFLGTSLVATACMQRGGDGSNTDLDSAAVAVDDADGVGAEGDMMAASVDGTEMTSLTAPTAIDVAARIAANVSLRWNPSACATVNANGANVTITYDDCTGPRGLVHVSGELDLAISIDASGAISVHATATDLQVNRAIIDVDATGVYTVSGDSRQLVVSSTGSGTGPLGNDIEHQGDYTVSWDSSTECRSVVGHWETSFTGPNASLERSNDVDLERCGGGCPVGTLTHHFIGGQSLTVTFDGTATATFATSGGRTGSLDLRCDPQ